jgi:hypothetical protein
LNSENNFGVKPLAVTLYYCPLSTGFITKFSQNLAKLEPIWGDIWPYFKYPKLPPRLLKDLKSYPNLTHVFLSIREPYMQHLHTLA